MAKEPRAGFSSKYCFLYDKKQENDVSSKLDAYKLLDKPVVYVNKAYPYELLVDGIIGEDVTQYADYDVFWELIIKLWKDDSFYENKTYLNYGASNVIRDKDYLQFTRKNIEWRIYLTFERLYDEYPVVKKYLVFFDENETIQHDEMFSTMMFFVNNLGRDNPYTSIKRYEYQDAQKRQLFYVFYYGVEPDLEKCKSVIREELVRRFGYEEAKRRYPSLFIDSFRKVYLLVENRGYPIDFIKLQEFVMTKDIFKPEIINLLDWSVPLVVEYGISDIIPNFSPVTEGDAKNDKFIYFLSKVLNYLQGKVLTPEFIIEAQFTENDKYAAFIYAGVEWQVQKMNYKYPINIKN